MVPDLTGYLLHTQMYQENANETIYLFIYLFI